MAHVVTLHLGIVALVAALLTVLAQFGQTSFVLKRGKLYRSSGQWQDEDYDVRANGKLVGRLIHAKNTSGPPELRWTWSITAIAQAIPGETNGQASTRAEAMAKFRAAWAQHGKK
jgi:hypothetical protein